MRWAVLLLAALFSSVQLAATEAADANGAWLRARSWWMVVTVRVDKIVEQFATAG